MPSPLQAVAAPRHTPDPGDADRPDRCKFSLRQSLPGRLLPRPHGIARLPEMTATSSSALTARARFVWIAAPTTRRRDRRLGRGRRGDQRRAVRCRTRHSFGPAWGQVFGYFHLVAALTVRGRGFRRRCFLTDGYRLILPAFGAYAGGLNALDPAIAEFSPTTTTRRRWAAAPCGGCVAPAQAGCRVLELEY